MRATTKQSQQQEASVPPEAPKGLRVLIAGTGFLATSLARALSIQNHVVLAGRRPPLLSSGRAVLPEERMADKDAWAPLVRDADVVINTIGTIIGDEKSLRTANRDIPCAVFDACLEVGGKRLIHVSALGVDEPELADLPFMATKAAAEDHLRRNDPGCRRIAWTILRPSIVVGRGGHSTALFATLAAFPVVLDLTPVAGDVQPIHIDDFAAVVTALVPDRTTGGQSMQVVGPEPMPVTRLVKVIGAWMHGRSPRPLTLPRPLLNMMLQTTAFVLPKLFSPGMLRALKVGNTAEWPAALNDLGVKPRPLAEVLAVTPTEPAERTGMLSQLFRPVMRVALAFLWLITGYVSVFAYPLAESVDLVVRTGVPERFAAAAVLVAAGWDAVLGVALLIGWRTRLVLLLQLATMAVFTAIITATLPAFWADPFGPITKNVVVAAATLWLFAVEDRHGRL